MKSSNFTFSPKDSVDNLQNLVCATLRCTPTAFTAEISIRSNVDSLHDTLFELHRGLAARTGWSVELVSRSNAWEYQPDSQFLNSVCQAFCAVHGVHPPLEQIHAGVEGGIFQQKAAALGRTLQVVNVGCTTLDVHKVSIHLTKIHGKEVLAVCPGPRGGRFPAGYRLQLGRRRFIRRRRDLCGDVYDGWGFLRFHRRLHKRLILWWHQGIRCVHRHHLWGVTSDFTGSPEASVGVGGAS